MRTLHLTLKKKWYDMIASGEKKEEYRENKQYWRTRLQRNSSLGMITKEFDVVVFKNGYSKNAPTIKVECKGVSTGKAKPEWSDNHQGEVFVIKLGNILTPQP